MTVNTYATVVLETGAPNYEGRITIHDSGWVELHDRNQWVAPKHIIGPIEKMNATEAVFD